MSAADLDESLYSRQLYVLGHEAMHRMRGSQVLVVGVKGLGQEIAKNLVLAGVGSVSLLDNGAVEEEDLGAGFFFREEDVGRSRAASVVERLAEINPYVVVRTCEVEVKELDEEKIKEFTVVVLTDCSISTQLHLDEVCRKSGKGLVVADAHGVVGSVFVDFGKEFVVSDVDGEQPIKGLISAITHDELGVVTVLEERRHGLSDGMLVSFGEVEGMTELNQTGPFPVKSLGPFTFSIGDTTGLSQYTGGGYFTQVKTPKAMSFKSLAENLSSPQIVSTDYGKIDDEIQLHLLNLALSGFREKYQRFPEFNSKEDANIVVEMSRKAASSLTSSVTVNEKLIFKLARCSGAQIAPVTSFVGGFAAQEALKGCSGKFSPLMQFMYFDSREIIPETDDWEEFASPMSRYRHQIGVVGKSVHERVINQKVFLVGAGAIGCEMLKIWALMGVSTGPNGQIIVTDMDTIEKSNLNRQFLFRNADVGKLKSITAAKMALKMNSSLKIVPHSNRVGADTEDVYNEDFWESLDVVCTALDNINARLYVDQRCVYFKKPMLESGTLGTKGNTQIVVPFVTESYGSTRDPPEEDIPLCTLKNFPNQIEHTIQWARDMFEGLFRQGPEEVNSYITNANYLDQLSRQPSSELETLKTILSLVVTQKPSSYMHCVDWARSVFELEFSHNIRQLLHNFPLDSVTSSGAKFWSGTKRAPSPLNFDPSDPLHLNFIISAANLRAHIFGIPVSMNAEQVKAYLPNAPVEHFEIKMGLKIATSDEELKEQKSNQELPDAGNRICDLVSQLPSPSSLVGFKLNPIDFEKDDDGNYHMDFITSVSNLRARNYRIKEVSKHETKRIAGKIIPAIATTTALVSGLICVEMFKLCFSGPLPIESYRSAFVNLALPFSSFAEPRAPEFKVAPIKSGEWKWSLWDHIEINMGKDITLGELIEHVEETYGLEISMISYGVSMLYSFFTSAKKLAERKKLSVSAAVEETSKQKLSPVSKYLLLEVIANIPDGEDVEIPYLRYRYRF